MLLRSAVITTNPRSYETTSDEFPDLFPAIEEPDIQFATSSYYAFKSIKFPKKLNVWFSRYRLLKEKIREKRRILNESYMQSIDKKLQEN